MQKLNAPLIEDVIEEIVAECIADNDENPGEALMWKLQKVADIATHDVVMNSAGDQTYPVFLGNLFADHQAAMSAAVKAMHAAKDPVASRSAYALQHMHEAASDWRQGKPTDAAYLSQALVSMLLAVIKRLRKEADLAEAA